MNPNKTNIQLLVDALRSGEFRQCTGALSKESSNGVTHCCLGVATVIAKSNGVQITEQPLSPVSASCTCNECAGSIQYMDPETGERSATTLIPVVQNFYGFNTDNPVLLQEDGTVRSATSMNDRMGNTFPEIADAFERTYLK